MCKVLHNRGSHWVIIRMVPRQFSKKITLNIGYKQFIFTLKTIEAIYYMVKHTLCANLKFLKNYLKCHI